MAAIGADNSYGRGGVDAFIAAARVEQVEVLASIRFPPGATEAELRAEGGPIEQLRASGARVILIFCHFDDAQTVIQAARASGVGGAGRSRCSAT